MSDKFIRRRLNTQLTSGFTLVEVLLVMLIMSIMAALSWQGLATVANSLSITQTQELALSDIESSLSQWQIDLDATLSLQPAPGLSSISWDGKVLRLVRRAPALGENTLDTGFQVVAWSARTLTSDELKPLGTPFAPGLYWLRWQSESFNNLRDLNNQLEMATSWSQSASTPLKSKETVLFPIQQWQIFFYRDNAWSNSLSSAGSATSSTADTSFNASNIANSTSSRGANFNNTSNSNAITASTLSANANANASASSTSSTNASAQSSFIPTLDAQLPKGIRLKLYPTQSHDAQGITENSWPRGGDTNDGSISLDWVRPNLSPARS